MSLRKKSSMKKSIPTLPLSECLAKTWIKNGQIAPGRTVEEHCRIAGAIAEKLLTGYFSLISYLFPKHSIIAAIMHDIGKVSPTFQKKIRRHFQLNIPELIEYDAAREKEWGGHWGVGYACVFVNTNNERLARITGFHHGKNFSDMRSAKCYDYGGVEWEALRKELLQKLIDSNELPKIEKPLQEILILGLVVLADWLASGTIFNDPAEDWRDKIDLAIGRAGLTIPAYKKDLKFRDIFPFEPNAIQLECLEKIKEPGVYVIEAPMGMGKTEAALGAAYQLLATGKARGIYFGLPTQLTSNKIHERVEAFLEKILFEQSSAILVHGNAHLKKFYDLEMGKEGSPGGSWFDGSRRGLLAPFAVGTLDQALLSVLHVRHSALRALGLAGKVVILDEVHSYDAYTGELLDELVARLREYSCTVIILSATLTNERRAKMIGCDESESNAYPLLTFVNGNLPLQEISPPATTEKSVKIHLENDEETAIEESLARAEKGQQVLWIENTVAKAQELYMRLGARSHSIDVECGLLHSRYTPRNRNAIEKKWTYLYGKSSTQRSTKGRILIGTQVLEQSLDLDADFLVTRLCPSDMILQRMGRLWRHERNDRADNAICETWILTPPLKAVLEDPKNALLESGTSYIYSPYVLGRTLEVWNDKTTINLPCDIRCLLEATYAGRDNEPTEKMAEEKYHLKELREMHERLARAGKSTTGKMLDDNTPGTRLGNRDELRLLILRDLDLEKGVCVCVDGSECELKDNGNYSQNASVAAQLELNILRIPKKGAPDKIKSDYLRKFKPFIFEANLYDRDNVMHGGELRIALLDEGQILRDIFGSRIEGLRYSEELGYLIEN